MSAAFTAKNREWEQQALDIAAQFTLAPFKVRSGRWHAVMVNADGVQFDELYNCYVTESGMFGHYSTKVAAAAHVMTSSETRYFMQACFHVAECTNPFDPFAEVAQ
jgi:hypothetical protein